MANGLSTLIFLRNYNNHFNRIIKKFDTIQGYINTHDYSLYTDINFNPNDGVDTYQVINWNQNWHPDYMLVSDGTNLISRWFVIESRRTRTGQYQIELRRDLIADHFNEVINAPCFVEKAILNPSDKFIFNPEGGSYNQIKKDEILLKDYTNSAWIVGYTARDFTRDEDIVSFTSNRRADYIWNDDDFPTPGNTKTHRGVLGGSLLKIMTGLGSWSRERQFKYQINIDEERFDLLEVEKFSSNDNYFLWTDAYTSLTDERKAFITNTLNSNYTGIFNAIKQEFPEFVNSASSLKFNELWNSNGKTVLYNDGSGDKLYQINVVKRLSEDKNDVVLNSNAAIGTAIQNTFPETDWYEKQLVGSPFKLSWAYIDYDITLIPYETGTYTVPFTDAHRELIDAPYDMFAIPYSDINIYMSEPSLLFKNSPDMAITLAQGLASKLTSSVVYDLQLLPYCPLTVQTNDDGIVLQTLESGIDYDLFTYKESEDVDAVPVGVIFWCNVSNGTFNIPYNITIDDVKIENECDMWRLSSPNFNGTFEFNAAKNDGVDYFNVDWTYKPYNPYIHINPNFKNLYGKDFNDARGLICGGDFSVALIDNKFAEYEIQNRNYQNIFNREIQNMDVNFAIDTAERTAKAASDYGFAKANGAEKLDLAKKGVDYAIEQAAATGRYIEARDFKTDMYNFQLGNVKALPQSLTKSSALTYNNKIWPILEYFTATDDEKNALRNKIRYNGMTVMRIGTIYEFLSDTPQFFQGQLIRLEDIDDDAHILNAIYTEIKKGVYI